MEQTVKENFKKWNDALQTKEPKEVAKLYSLYATFLPTLLGEFLFGNGEDGSEKYFHHFLLKAPFGKIIEEKVQVISPEVYLHSGHYDFEVGPEDKREVAHARFTYIWQKIKGDWKIIHHHSSLVPENN